MAGVVAAETVAGEALYIIWTLFFSRDGRAGGGAKGRRSRRRW